MYNLEHIGITVFVMINIYFYVNHILYKKKILKLLKIQGKAIRKSINQDIYFINGLYIILNYKYDFDVFYKLFSNLRPQIIIVGDIKNDWLNIYLGKKTEWCKYLKRSLQIKNLYGTIDNKLIDFFNKYKLKQFYISFIDEYNLYLDGDLEFVCKFDFLNDLFENLNRLEKCNPSEKLIATNKEILMKIKQDKSHEEMINRMKIIEEKKILERQKLGLEVEEDNNIYKQKTKYINKKK